MSKKCDQRPVTNYLSLSEVMSFRKPKRKSLPESSALEQDSAVMSTIGMGSGTK